MQQPHQPRGWAPSGTEGCIWLLDPLEGPPLGICGCLCCEMDSVGPSPTHTPIPSAVHTHGAAVTLLRLAGPQTSRKPSGWIPWAQGPHEVPPDLSPLAWSPAGGRQQHPLLVWRPSVHWASWTLVTGASLCHLHEAPHCLKREGTSWPLSGGGQGWDHRALCLPDRNCLHIRPLALWFLRAGCWANSSKTHSHRHFVFPGPVG